jgi:hypothetical protein
VAHDFGLSTWFGGTLFGQVSLNPADFAPVAFLLASLEEARVRVVECRFEVGQTIYVRGNQNRHLYFVIAGVIK